MTKDEKSKRYDHLRENLKKAQKAYRTRKTAEGAVRSSVWVQKGKERALALPIAVADFLDDLKRRYPSDYSSRLGRALALEEAREILFQQVEPRKV